MRTKKQIEYEKKHYSPVSHAGYCNYPKSPCDCEVDNLQARRTTHKNYCNYPKELCDCGLK